MIAPDAVSGQQSTESIKRVANIFCVQIKKGSEGVFFSNPAIASLCEADDTAGLSFSRIAGGHAANVSASTEVVSILVNHQSPIHDAGRALVQGWTKDPRMVYGFAIDITAFDVAEVADVLVAVIRPSMGPL